VISTSTTLWCILVQKAYADRNLNRELMKVVIKRNAYTWIGLGLLVTGFLVSIFSFLVFNSNWVTALGISMVILAVILIALGRTIPKLPTEVSTLFFETGINNIDTILEEFGISTNAIFLPSSITNDKPAALIPLNSNHSSPLVINDIPKRFIVKYGDNPDDIGLLLSTVGTTAVAMLQSKPGPTPDELESALTSLFSGTLDAADGTSVIVQGNHISVTINNPRIENKISWSHQCLGGPLATIVASITSEAWDKPIIINQEKQDGRKHIVEIEVIG
jgi:hypothetical protein